MWSMPMNTHFSLYSLVNVTSLGETPDTSSSQSTRCLNGWETGFLGSLTPSVHHRPLFRSRRPSSFRVPFKFIFCLYFKYLSDICVQLRLRVVRPNNPLRSSS